MSNESDNTGYVAIEPSSVGYKNPPTAHRFQKGRSGNPRGRPSKKTGAPTRKTIKDVEALMLEEAYRLVSIREGDKVIRIPTIQAVMRGLGVAAIKGDRRAQLAFKELTEEIETKKRVEKQQLFEVTAEYKWKWEREFKECDRLGLDRPDPVPHPDDIQIDVIRGEARIVGPKDDLEKAAWDEAHDLKKTSLENIKSLMDLAKTAPKASNGFKEAIALWKNVVRYIDYHKPDEATRRSFLYDPYNLGDPPEQPKFTDSSKPSARATKAAVRRRTKAPVK